MSSAIERYQKVSLNSTIEDVNTYKVIQILMGNALDKIAKAIFYIKDNKVAEKGLHISLAITTIDALQASLDLDKGGDLARNLSDLYHYMVDKLVLANINNDLKLLDEISGLLITIKSGWDGIEEEAIKILSANKKQEG
jgi:flagellar protein FliS